MRTFSQPRLVIAAAVLCFARSASAGVANRRPDRHIELPPQCHIIQLKSMESSNYLGVGSAAAGGAGEEVSADHPYDSESTHFQVRYYSKPSSWMTLSVPSQRGSSSEAEKESFLGFERTGKPRIVARRLGDRLPENISFVLSGWPVIRNSTHQVIYAGPYYRLHLVEANNREHRIATVGADRAGRITLYPAEDASHEQGESFAKPPTLFLLSVVRTVDSCNSLPHIPRRRRSSRLNSSTSSAGDSAEDDKESQKPAIIDSSAPLPVLVKRLLTTARQL